MRIFVTGAAGYIGEAVAIAYRRAGHDVYGLVRNAAAPAAKNLALNEVNLVVGDLTKPETYEEIASTADLLVHTAADYTQYDNTDGTTIKTFLSAASKRGKKRVTFIYTSGILVYPDSKNVHNEDDPVDPNAFAILKTRQENERLVLASDIVHGVVLRPSFVYGGRGPNFVSYFKAAEEGNVGVQGPNLIWSEVHIHDLADAYLKIGEAAGSVVGGQIFNIADDSRNTNLAIATRFAQVVGYKGEIKEVPYQGFIFANKTSIVDYRKATRLVGWVPKHKNLLDDAETLYKAWKAQQ